VNFSLLYGKSAFGLSQELGIDRETAKKYIEAYFAKYPKVKGYLDSIIKNARRHGFTETIFGRKIYLPNINHHNKVIREAEERLALNAPMQGSSADIIKIAMLRIEKWLKQHNLTSKIVLQIHDELILECKDEEVELIVTNLPILMTRDYNLLVDLEVGCKNAKNWEEAH
jgi:DNA polymerase-1